MKDQNQEREFESLLKEKADGFELKPSEEIWQNVSSTIHKNRWWKWSNWLMAALLLTVISTSAYYILQKESDANQQENFTESKSPQNSEKNSSEKQPFAPQSDTLITSPEEPLAEERNRANEQSDNRNDQQEISNSTASLPTVIPVTSTESSGAFKNDKEMNYMPLKKQPLAWYSGDIDFIFQAEKHKLVEDDPGYFVSHSLWLEIEGMPLINHVSNSFSNTVYEADQSGTTTFSSSIEPAPENTFWLRNGFSAGGNIFYEVDDIWFVGAGIHFTRNFLHINYPVTSISEVDTNYYYDDSVLISVQVVTNTSTSSPVLDITNEWLEGSVMGGVKLFPESKNHLRLLAGTGYSRLLKSTNSSEAVADIATYQYEYRRDQWQLFTEAAYQRDFTPEISGVAGIQLHYFPLNLQVNEVIDQRLYWVGFKAGMVFKF